MLKTLQVASWKNFMNHDSDTLPFNDGTYSAIINNWGREVWNDWMKKLVENHDYIAAHALMEVQRYNESVGVKTNTYSGQSHNYAELIANALTFNVRHEIDLQGEGVLFYRMSGDTTVRMDQGASYERFGSKAGTGNYDNAKAESMAHDGPFSYDQTVLLSNFDPCFNKTIMSGFSVFGAEQEQWHETESGWNVPITFPGMVYMSFYAYHQNRIDPTTGLFMFELPLKNMSAQAADETFFMAADVVFGLTVTLTHAPEGEVYIK
jgi:hypothetical protein